MYFRRVSEYGQGSKRFAITLKILIFLQKRTKQREVNLTGENLQSAKIQ